MSTVRLLGLDPSLSHTGWCVLEVDTEARAITKVLIHGTVVTEKSKNKKVRKSSDDLERARTIARYLQEVIKVWDIKLAASEVPSGAQSASASRAFGIVVGLLASLSVPIIEVSPTEVKMAVAGNKIADKEDIVRWAVGLTERCGGSEHWNTGKAKNDWEITIGGRYVLKNMEHQGDAIAAGQAAVASEQFNQLAGFLASILA